MSHSTEHENGSSREGGTSAGGWHASLRPLAVSLVFLAAFLALDVLTQGLEGPLSVSLWFLPAGLTLATLLVFGWRYAPVIALVFGLHTILFRDGLGYPLGVLIALPVLYAALYAGAAAFLVGGVGMDPRLVRMRDVAWFVGVGCFLTTFLGGVVAASGMVLAGYVPNDAYRENLLGLWAGDATGVGVLASLLLVALRPFPSLWASLPAGRSAVAPSFRLPSREELPEVALQGAALALALAIAYQGAGGDTIEYAYLALAPLVWATLRGGFERATIAVLLTNIGVVVLVGVAGGGANPVTVQFGLMALTLVGLLLGGLASEHSRTEKALLESERRFRSVVQNSSEVVKILDPDGTLRYASPAFGRTFGYGVGEVLNKNIYEYVHPEDLPHIIEETRKALAETGVANNKAEYRFRHADGSWRHVESVGTYLIEDPAVRGVVVNTRDVTDRRRTEAKLEQSNDLLRAIMEGTDDAAFVKDLEGRYLLINRAGAEALGMGAEEIIGKDDTELFPVEDAREVMELDRRVVESGETLTTEDTKKPADGEVRTFLSTRGPYRDARGSIIGMFGVARDITRRKSLEELIAHQAYHDELTDLPNRYLLMDRLRGALARAGRRPAGRGVALLFLDLDGFKVVNDSLGHEAGDRLLVEAAGRIQEMARSGDTVARLGGDEFCVLLEDADVGEATRVAERILGEFGRAPFLLDDGSEGGHRRVFVGTSVGIGVSRPDQRPSELLREADLAMYRAKEEGKGRYAIFEQYLSERARERASLEGDLRHAIERGEFEVLYQPQVCLSSGRILWMEALLRWNHPERGLLPPEAFVPLAEETNLICPITSWVLENALRQCLRWKEEHDSSEEPEEGPPPPGVCVNLSARQLPEEGFVEAIGGMLDSTGAAPGALGLEVTESGLIEDERASSALSRLREMGVVLFIDDFGTGHSSLSSLGSFPANVLKIGGAFVHGLGERPETTAMFSGMVKLAHSTGKWVVAERVEHPRQLAVVREMGCELGQGYLFSRPLPAEEASRLVRSYSPETMLSGLPREIGR